MKNKLLVLNLLLGVLAVGCSESAYTPNTGVPANNTGIMPNYNSGTIPPYYYQNNPMMNQQGMYQQGMYQQGMMTYNMRMNTPGFYLNKWRSRSCVPQRPYITTCTQQTVRRTCPRYTTTLPSTTTVVTTQTTTGDATTKVLPISWTNEDAQALYQRLAKEEDTLSKGNILKSTVKTRTGEHYNCIVDGKESRAKNYVCDLEIRVKDGMLLQQLPVGKDGEPEITTSSMYKGDLLNIGVPGETPETGHLTIAGPSALFLFKNLPGEATSGKVEEAGILEAKIKTVGQVKCYQSVNTTATVTECLIKIDSSKGKALNF